VYHNKQWCIRASAGWTGCSREKIGRLHTPQQTRGQINRDASEVGGPGTDKRIVLEYLRPPQAKKRISHDREKHRRLALMYVL